MEGGQRAYAAYTYDPQWGLVMAGGYHVAFYSENPIRHRTGKLPKNFKILHYTHLLGYVFTRVKDTGL